MQDILVGGKGGVGKTTVAAAIGWALASRYPDKNIRLISIDPAHSLGDAFGAKLEHKPIQITTNLSGQKINADIVLEQFRNDERRRNGSRGGENCLHSRSLATNCSASFT